VISTIKIVQSHPDVRISIAILGQQQTSDPCLSIGVELEGRLDDVTGAAGLVAGSAVIANAAIGRAGNLLSARLHEVAEAKQGPYAPILHDN
jgi:hypothetical protein